MKQLFLLLMIFSTFSCQSNQSKEIVSKNETPSVDTTQLIREVNQFMNDWHTLAGKADTSFFTKMAPKGIYIGTDKSELWEKEQFQQWSKPFFDKGKAWDFKTISRNVYFSDDHQYAWFDELLDTWMGTCRTSGVLHHNGESWEIKHYHLSVTCPNEMIKDFILLVKTNEDKKKKP